MKMKGFLQCKLCSLIFAILIASSVFGQNDVTIENKEMRLVISGNGFAKSLLHKESGQECLAFTDSVPVFAVRQFNRLPSQEMLVHPAEPKLLPATKVQRVGDKLKINFKYLSYEVTLGLNITDSYIGFTVDNVVFLSTQGSDYTYNEQLSSRMIPPLDEIVFLRLPVRERSNFGEWLNVMHDNDVAVNVLASNEYAMIDSEKRSGYRILQARAVDEIKTLGVGAALITTNPNNLLDRIQQLEKDYNLPSGVKARRNDETKYSYYGGINVTPADIDQHIKYATAGGFKLFLISVSDFAITGHFNFLSTYKNGIADLKAIVDKINNAGMIAGLHLYASKVDKNDPYVSGGVPDHRLNLRKIFTLAEPITGLSTTITVEENPGECTRDVGRRILKVGKELITYEDYTTERPYQFTGCQRGQFKTIAYAQEEGFKFGLLDVDTWVKWVLYDQKTSIQEEAAERIGEIYNQCGFRFIYFDGSEDVNQPFWYYVHHAQKSVYDKVKPAPLFTEAAMRSHFSWHIASRGNAFDIQRFSPEQLKEAIRDYPIREARMVANDFTTVDFGWISNHPSGYWKNDSMVIQPDHIEYATSRAAGWNTGTSFRTNLSWSDAQPRIKDVYEVFNIWEKAREKKWLSEEQKAELRNSNFEHILFYNEKMDLELRPYYQITELPTKEIRAFYFQRGDKMVVVYWHISGESQFTLSLNKGKIRLFDSFYKKPLGVKAKRGELVLPAGGRRYLECGNLSKDQVIEAFKNLRLLKSNTEK